MPPPKRKKKRRKPERTQLSMRMVSTYRLLLRLSKKPPNFNKCLLLVKQQLSRKFRWNKNNLQENPLFQRSQSSRKRMTVMSRQLRRSSHDLICKGIVERGDVVLRIRCLGLSLRWMWR